jgi:hypothetical protein
VPHRKTWCEVPCAVLARLSSKQMCHDNLAILAAIVEARLGSCHVRTTVQAEAPVTDSLQDQIATMDENAPPPDSSADSVKSPSKTRALAQSQDHNIMQSNAGEAMKTTHQLFPAAVNRTVAQAQRLAAAQRVQVSKRRRVDARPAVRVLHAARFFVMSSCCLLRSHAL